MRTRCGHLIDPVSPTSSIYRCKANEDRFEAYAGADGAQSGQTAAKYDIRKPGKPSVPASPAHSKALQPPHSLECAPINLLIIKEDKKSYMN